MLRACGLLYRRGLRLQSLGPDGAGPAAGGRRQDKWAKGLDTPEASLQCQREFAAALAAEVADADCSSVVMSLEQLSSRLRTEEDVRRLQALFEQVGFETVRIVAYLRPQAEFLTSWYSTVLKTGQRTAPFSLPTPADPEFPFLTYLPTLDLWAAVFGAANVMVAAFQRSRLLEGNIIDDFLARIGAAAATRAGERARDQNPSLDPTTAEVVRRLNAHLGPLVDEAGVNRYRKHFRRIAEQASTSQRLTLSEADTQRFMAQFESSNAEIARRFCAGETLFDPVHGEGDTSFYQHPLSMDAAFEVFARLLKAQQRLLEGIGKGKGKGR